MMPQNNSNYESTQISIKYSILDAYGLEPIEVEECEGYFKITNSNKQIFRLTKFTRRSASLTPLLAMEHLKKNNFSRFLKLIPIQEGHLFYSDNNNEFYFLTEWMQTLECNLSNPERLKQAAKTLGELHLASCGFTCGEAQYPNWIDEFQDYINEMNNHHTLAVHKVTNTGFDRKYLDAYEKFFTQAYDALEILKNSAYLELVERCKASKSFAHLNYRAENLAIDKNLDIHIIDCLSCGHDIWAVDLASLISEAAHNSYWDINAVNSILDGYSISRKLEKDEFRVIYAFLLFPKRFYRIGKNYYIKKKDFSENSFNRKIGKMINAEDMRRSFLDAFYKTYCE